MPDFSSPQFLLWLLAAFLCAVAVSAIFLYGAWKFGLIAWAARRGLVFPSFRLHHKSIVHATPVGTTPCPFIA